MAPVIILVVLKNLHILLVGAMQEVFEQALKRPRGPPIYKWCISNRLVSGYISLGLLLTLISACTVLAR